MRETYHGNFPGTFSKSLPRQRLVVAAAFLLTEIVSHGHDRKALHHGKRMEAGLRMLQRIQYMSVNVVGRPLLLVGGLTMMALGFAGIVLPFLPATPFFLAAAWLFSRSSPRLERWLFALPGIGDSLRDWRRHRAISRRAKIVALAALGLSALLIVLQSPPALVAWPVLAIILTVAVFIVTRATPPRLRGR